MQERKKERKKKQNNSKLKEKSAHTWSTFNYSRPLMPCSSMTIHKNTPILDSKWHLRWFLNTDNDSICWSDDGKSFYKTAALCLTDLRPDVVDEW